MKHLVRFIQAIAYLCGMVFLFALLIFLNYIIVISFNPDFVITL